MSPLLTQAASAVAVLRRKTSRRQEARAHLPHVLATIARFGGRVVAGGGNIDLLEGDPMPERIFIIECSTAGATPRATLSLCCANGAGAAFSAKSALRRWGRLPVSCQWIDTILGLLMSV